MTGASNRTRRALVLSGPIGRGHVMMARACTEVLADDGWDCETRDSMAMLGGPGARLGARISARLMTTRGVHDALHFAHLRTGSRLALGMAALSDRQVVPALRRQLAERPVDLLLSVFATGAGAASRATRSSGGDDGSARPRTVVLCTDACPHRLWVWPGTDLFLVTSEAAAASVRRFQPGATIRVVPPPVRAAFFDAPPRAAARAALGIPEDAPCVLMLDSGWGFGQRLEAARQLAGHGVHVVAVAGRDLAADDRWRSLAAGQPRVHAVGVSDDVPLLMSAADLVLALPGATICGEARAMGRHLVLLDLMPGHGRDNLQQQLDLGDAAVCDASAPSMRAAVLAAFDRGVPARPRADPQGWPGGLRAALADVGLADGRTATAPTSPPLSVR